MKRYNNYHKHTYYQNIFTPDTHTQIDDYCKRAIELGHNSYFTTEHGYGGDVFACKEACEKYGLKCVFGYEGYIVKDAKEKDDRNYHIVIIPRTNLARRKVNLLISNANIDGFYRKPRIFLQELLSFDKEDIYITTACVASFLRDDDGIENIFIPLYNKFSDNLFIEVQPHNHPSQIEHNKKALYLQEKYGLRLISANDSHYILPEDTKKRNTFLMGKHINYGDEDSFILDYPEYDTIIERYIEQGVLTKEQAITALDNTLIFDECEEIDINREPKMPTIYPNLNIEEKFELLKDLAYKNLYKMFDDENTPEENKQAYIDELNNDLKVVKETSAMNTADYFLLDNAIVSKAVNDYGGIITKTGRGSGGAFLLNKAMGLTQLDKFSTNIPMYSERFMSTARILENRSFPDVDCNLVDAEPFVKASRDYLGYHGCYPMVAFGTMEISESFRNSCRARNVEYEQLNEAAKNIEKLTDDEFFGPIIKEAEGMCGVIVNMSIHPCSYCLFNGDLREEIGIVRSGEDCVAIITSTESDNWKYVKNDYLRITALSIISKVFQKIGRPIMSLKELRNSVDDKVWDIYAKGLTCTINQVDSDWGTSLAMRYRPRSIDEVAMLTAAIRPSFDPWRDTFINRENYTTGNKYMDKLLEKTGHYILFQENLMQYFEWLGVSPAESIGLIKKISKKKIHKEDFDALENRIKKSWIEKTGAIDGFQENWDMVQSCMAYGFNCVSGDTIIDRGYRNGSKQFTVEELYNIHNNRKYAKETGHLNLYSKLRTVGYGHGYSLYDDNTIKLNKIVDIKYAGKKEVYLVTTESGKTIKCTLNHKFPTPSGKKQLSELKIGDVLYTKGVPAKQEYKYALTNGDFEKNLPKKGQQGFQKKPEGVSVLYDNYRIEHIKAKAECDICKREYDGIYRFEVHHRDFNRKNNDTSNFQWLCCSCHKKQHYKHGRNKARELNIIPVLEKIVSIQYVGIESTYDVAMEAPAHNFAVQSGIITSNSPHGVAYGYDSVYGAYLKSHYPFEYYSVVLELYKDDQVRTRKLTEEMKYFGISLEMPKFGKSRSTYTENKELKTIYKGLQSIKFLNAESAEYLYSLKDNKYETFLDLLLNSIKTGPVDSRKLDILIKLEYFSEFGKIKKLLKYVKIFEMFKKGDVKVFDKQKLFGTWVYNVVKRHSSETNKQFRDIDLSKCFDEIKLYIENDVDDDVSISQKIEWQLEYLGYVDFKTNNPDDRRKLVILEVRPLISKKTGKIWKISIDTISIGTGKRASLLLSETLYRQKNIKKDDVIFVGPGMLKKEEWGGRTNWLLLNCEKIDI